MQYSITIHSLAHMLKHTIKYIYIPVGGGLTLGVKELSV